MIVLWKITERCGLRCPFCACDASLPYPRKDAEPRLVSRFGRALSEYAARRGSDEKAKCPILVSWLGGEPFMWPYLEAIELEFTERLGLSLSVTTNGTLLGSKPFRSRLLDRYTEVTVSLDAAGAGFDALRGWPGGFEALRKGIEQLSSERIKRGAKLLIRVNAVLTRETISEVRELVRAVSRIGVDELTFNALGGVERPDYFQEHALEAAQIADFMGILPELRSIASGGGTMIAGSGSYFERMLGAAKGLLAPVSDCRPGKDVLYIGTDGRVAPCFEAAAAAGMPLSRVLHAENIEVLPQLFVRRLETTRARSCMDCHSSRYFGKFIKEHR